MMRRIVKNGADEQLMELSIKQRSMLLSYMHDAKCRELEEEAMESLEDLIRIRKVQRDRRLVHKGA